MCGSRLRNRVPNTSVCRCILEVFTTRIQNSRARRSDVRTRAHELNSFTRKHNLTTHTHSSDIMRSFADFLEKECDLMAAHITRGVEGNHKFYDRMMLRTWSNLHNFIAPLQKELLKGSHADQAGKQSQGQLDQAIQSPKRLTCQPVLACFPQAPQLLETHGTQMLPKRWYLQ
jgi:hypothetical protein